MSSSRDLGLETPTIPMMAIDDVLGDFGFYGDVLVFILMDLWAVLTEDEEEVLPGFTRFNAGDAACLAPQQYDLEETPEERAAIDWYTPDRIAEAAERLALAFEAGEIGALRLWERTKNDRIYGQALRDLAYRIDHPLPDEIEGITPGDWVGHFVWHLRKLADFCEVMEEEDMLEVRVCYHD